MPRNRCPDPRVTGHNRYSVQAGPHDTALIAGRYWCDLEKNNLPTFEFTIARIDKNHERKRSEIDANGPKNVLGGLDVVAEAEGLSSTV
jgi:hypothetical protein